MNTEFFFKKDSPKWRKFKFTVVLYIIINSATIYTTWISAIDDDKKWADISFNDKSTLVALLFGGAATQIRSLMNADYAESKKETNDNKAKDGDDSHAAVS